MGNPLEIVHPGDGRVCHAPSTRVLRRDSELAGLGCTGVGLSGVIAHEDVIGLPRFETVAGFDTEHWVVH